MACATCSHTVQNIASFTPAIFWCPLCGTLKMAGSVPESEQPKIVERLRKLLLHFYEMRYALESGDVNITQPDGARWNQIMLALRAAEECLKPEERRTR
jgi:hypothetical protein